MSGGENSVRPAAGSRGRTVLAAVLLRDVPFWNRTRGRRFFRFLAFTGYLYVGVLVMLLALENYFLFRPDRAADFWFDPPPGLAVEDVELTSADGTRLHGWWSAPAGWTPDKGALLYCHGNAGNLSSRGAAVMLWQKHLDVAVLIFDYPGYGKSDGRPSEAGCYAAGDAAYDWVVRAQKVRAEDMILLGKSLGGAIATDLASRKPSRALVLLAAFSSFPDMAQKTFPWLPGRWLVSNRMDNLAKIAGVKVPVFIGHGTADTLVPFTHGERLFAAAAEPKRFFPMPGLGHGGADEAFYAACRHFLEEHPTSPR